MRASWHRSGLCRPASSSSPHVWPVCESFVTWIAQRGEETLPFMQHPWQVRALLVLKLLRIPSSALCPTRQVGTDTARCWQRFVLFFDSSEAEQRLKKVCLCLLMTDVALAIAAKKHDKRQGQEPTILRLSRGDVQLAASKQLQAILANMHVDRDIDASDVLTGLLTTHGHLTVRFLDFAQWPFRIWTLSQKYNPDAYVSAIEGFLDSVSAELDAGFSRASRCAPARIFGRCHFLLAQRQHSVLCGPDVAHHLGFQSGRGEKTRPGQETGEMSRAFCRSCKPQLCASALLYFSSICNHCYFPNPQKSTQKPEDIFHNSCCSKKPHLVA